jgi:RNA polymerase sigma-70 factor (ECF subfamily)
LTVNACLDAVRKRRRRPIEVDLEPISPPMIGDETALIANRDLIERGFHRLRPDQRAILVLHYYLGLSTSAIAETLGVPQGTAQSRLHAALSAMRAALAAVERAPEAVRREAVA